MFINWHSVIQLRFTVFQNLSAEAHHSLDSEYENILGMLVNMQKHPEKWGI